MRKSLLLLATALMVTLMLGLFIGVASAYTLLDRRWPETLVPAIYYYDFSGYSEVVPASDSWCTTPIRPNLYKHVHWTSAYVFVHQLNNPGVSWDGATQLYPGPSGPEYTGADVYLNHYYLAGYVSEARQSVIAHEFGHVLGLGHELGAVLMNPWTFGTGSRWGTYHVHTQQQDDINGVNAIYGPP
jgi:hypothetical protein